MLKKWDLNSKVMNILIGTFFTRTALFMSIPYLAIFLTSQKNISLLHTGYILSINPLVNVLFSGFGGMLADKLSLKKIIRYVPVVWGSVFILFYFSDYFWQFLLLSSLNGLCYSIFEPASKKVLSTQTNKGNRLLVFNLRYAAINVGAFLGPLLSLLFNMKTTLFPYIILGIIYVLYGASTQFFFNDLPDTEAPVHQKTLHIWQAISILRKDYIYILLLIGMSFSFFGYSQLNATVSQYLANSHTFADGIKLYSTLLSINAAIILTTQFIVLKSIAKWNPFNVFILSNLLISISFLLFGFSSSYTLLFLSITLFSLGELLIGARFDTLVDELSSEASKGMYFGCSEFVKIGTVFGPIVGTGLLGQLGFQSGFPVFGLLFVITIMGVGFISMAKVKFLSTTAIIPIGAENKKKSRLE